MQKNNYNRRIFSARGLLIYTCHAKLLALLSADDGERLREICIYLTMTLHSDYCKFMEMPIYELIKTVEAAQKAVKKIGKRKHK